MADRAATHSEPLLATLHRLQDAHGHLPEDALAALAAERGMGRARLDDFVSFFHAFTRAPRPPAPRVCTGPACLVAGARDRLKTPGARPVHCLGRCEHAPVVLEGAAEALPRAAFPPETWDWLERFAAPGAAADLLDQVRASGLSGMGGAAFPGHRKLAAVRQAEAPRKYVIANADEGEPGTFKDRYLIERHPDELLAGIVLACRVTGADTAYIYIRDEYPAQERLLAEGLEALRAAGLAAREGPTPEAPAVGIVRGGGAYICGEESALIASLEGRRGEPHPGPPFPVERGLFGCPTLVHNVETLCYLARIARDGPAPFRGEGAGHRHYGVSGAVARPGVYELPADSTARTILAAAGGPTAELGAFIPGGASSGLLPPDALDTPLTAEGLHPWGTSPGTGGVVFVPASFCPVDLAASLMDFFAAESCGQCDPCRLGTRELAARLHGLARGQAPPAGSVEATAGAMEVLSICGLGRWAPLVATSLARHFAGTVAAHAAGRCPAGTCPVGAP